MLTNYQLSEVSLGSLFFVFIYLIGSYIIQGGLNLLDIIVTSFLFATWTSLTKIISNYMQFMKYDK